MEHLAALVDAVHADHLARLTLCQRVPVVVRGKRRRARPQTALIAERAQQIVARKARAGVT